MQPARHRPRVIAILGSPRSGSTLLERLLAASTPAVALGEVCFLWDRGAAEDQLCGCGARFWSCPFWTAVMEQAYGGGTGALDPDAVATDRDAALRTRRVRKILKGASVPAPNTRYADHVLRVVRAAATEVDGRPIIDSSKHAPHVATLSRLARAGAIELSVVHIVRDPRAVACSAQRRVARPEVWASPALMPRYAPSRTARQWAVAQLAAGLIRRHAPFVRIRYEDLVRDPDRWLSSAASLAGLTTVMKLADDRHRVVLSADHTVAGNPSRFRTGSVALEPDERWRRELSRRDRATVTLLTLPLLPLYGYPVTVAPKEDGPATMRG